MPATRRFRRYALYYVPPANARWVRFATSWLGWDLETGTAPPHPQVPELSLPIADITRTPRKYGLHATLKPPFRLAPDQTREDLEIACALLAGSLAPVHLNGLGVTRMGRFLALCPARPDADVTGLAARCVADLDRFCAPATGRDRVHARLTPSRTRNLARWGHPHVMDDFRFHITLTGRLPEAELADATDALKRNLAPLLPATSEISDLALVGENRDGRFHLLGRYPLSG
jgi:putative phosphonate metabolism protein